MSAAQTFVHDEIVQGLRGTLGAFRFGIKIKGRVVQRKGAFQIADLAFQFVDQAVKEISGRDRMNAGQQIVDADPGILLHTYGIHAGREHFIGDPETGRYRQPPGQTLIFLQSRLHRADGGSCVILITHTVDFQVAGGSGCHDLIRLQYIIHHILDQAYVAFGPGIIAVVIRIFQEGVLEQVSQFAARARPCLFLEQDGKFLFRRRDLHCSVRTLQGLGLLDSVFILTVDQQPFRPDQVLDAAQGHIFLDQVRRIDHPGQAGAGVAVHAVMGHGAQDHVVFHRQGVVLHRREHQREYHMGGLLDHGGYRSVADTAFRAAAFDQIQIVIRDTGTVPFDDLSVILDPGHIRAKEIL